jgi:hypothetical protein
VLSRITGRGELFHAVLHQVQVMPKLR